MRFLIIGGSDAGISAALRAPELDPRAEIAVLLEDEFPNYSICGLPFFLSGETPDWRSLAHRTDFGGVHILTRHRALRIDPAANTVAVLVNDTDSGILTYDKLLIATGATPMRPPIGGMSHLDRTDAERAIATLIETYRQGFLRLDPAQIASIWDASHEPLIYVAQEKKEPTYG